MRRAARAAPDGTSRPARATVTAYRSDTAARRGRRPETAKGSTTVTATTPGATPPAPARPAAHPAPPRPADGFHWHADRDEVEAGGLVIPGLRASFYRRPLGDRVETLGLYAYDERQLFAAWGFVGEQHCRFNAVRREAGGWYETRRGCPVLRPIRQGPSIVGLTVLAGRTLIPFRFDLDVDDDDPIPGGPTVHGSEPGASYHRGCPIGSNLQEAGRQWES